MMVTVARGLIHAREGIERGAGKEGGEGRRIAQSPWNNERHSLEGPGPGLGPVGQGYRREKDDETSNTG